MNPPRPRGFSKMISELENYRDHLEARIAELSRERNELSENNANVKRELKNAINAAWRPLVDAHRSATWSDDSTQHPSPPPPFAEYPYIAAPEISGIYFAFEEEKCVYVGQATNLRNRLARNHHALKNGDKLSFIPLPTHKLNYTEAFYIGTLRPARNRFPHKHKDAPKEEAAA